MRFRRLSSDDYVVMDKFLQSARGSAERAAMEGQSSIVRELDDLESCWLAAKEALRCGEAYERGRLAY